MKDANQTELHGIKQMHQLKATGLTGDQADALIRVVGEQVHSAVSKATIEFATKKDLAEIREVMATQKDLAEIREVMATQKDLAEIREVMATKKDLADTRADIEIELEKIRNNMVTKEVFLEAQAYNQTEFKTIYNTMVTQQNLLDLELKFMSSLAEMRVTVAESQKELSEKISKQIFRLTATVAALFVGLGLATLGYLQYLSQLWFGS